MRSLFRINILHAIRSRLFVGMVLCSLTVQYLGLKLTRTVVVHIQGDVQVAGVADTLLVGVFLQMFLGLFLAAIYGLWMLPYFHRGPRGELFSVMPIPKWGFSCSYAMALAGILAVQYLVLFFCLGWVVGFKEMVNAGLPWFSFGITWFFQLGACLAVMYSLSAGVLTFGTVPTLFMGTILMVILLMGGLVLEMDLNQMFGQEPAWFSLVRRIFLFLPPVKDFPSCLKRILSGNQFDWIKTAVSLFWLSAAAFWFTQRLNYPRRNKAKGD